MERVNNAANSQSGLKELINETNNECNETSSRCGKEMQRAICNRVQRVY